MFISVHLKAVKSDTMNPGKCRRGFTSYCLGDVRMLFIAVKMLECTGEIFFPPQLCKCVSVPLGNYDDSFFSQCQ